MAGCTFLGTRSKRGFNRSRMLLDQSSAMRFPLTVPRDIPPAEASRRLGLDHADFIAKLPNLTGRGFPQPDPDTGFFDSVAIDRWCDARHPHLFGGDRVMGARDAGTLARERIAKMKAAGAKRG
jgi:hypothetical protein